MITYIASSNKRGVFFKWTLTIGSIVSCNYNLSIYERLMAVRTSTLRKHAAFIPYHEQKKKLS